MISLKSLVLKTVGTAIPFLKIAKKYDFSGHFICSNLDKTYSVHEEKACDDNLSYGR
jgi:hypothetical protein